MITVIILLLISSILWASVTFLDKHLISNITKNNDYRGLYVFSTFVSAAIFIPIYLFLSHFQLSVTFPSLCLIFLTSLFEMGYLIFYMKAMAKDDTSVINILFQFTPVMTYFLGAIFLKETFTPVQMISGILIIIFTIAISIKRDENKVFDKNKLIALLFMFISCSILSLQNLIFKISTLETNFYTTMFYFQLFLFVLGAGSLLIPSFRYSFLDLVKNNKKKVFFFNIINEVANATANSLKVFAFTLAPIAFVSIFQNSTQIIIAFFMGILFTIFKPHIFKEDISKRTIIKKLLCIAVTIVATIFLIQ